MVVYWCILHLIKAIFMNDTHYSVTRRCLTNVNVFHVARFSAILALVWCVIQAIFAVMFLMGNRHKFPFDGIGEWFIQALILGSIVSVIVGFISGAIGAMVYNFIASKGWGIVFDTYELSSVLNDPQEYNPQESYGDNRGDKDWQAKYKD